MAVGAKNSCKRILVIFSLILVGHLLAVLARGQLFGVLRVEDLRFLLQFHSLILDPLCLGHNLSLDLLLGKDFEIDLELRRVVCLVENSGGLLGF